MITESLFVEPVSDKSIVDFFEKTAANTLRLVPEANWEQEIIKYIYENLPYITKYPFQVDIDERSDRQKGIGLGQVVVKGTVTIPIIINKKEEYSEMKPLDVFRANNKTYMLNKDKIDEILYSPEVGRIVDTRKMTQSLGADMQSDAMKNTTPPEVQGPGPGYTKVSALELALPYATNKDKEDIVAALNKPSVRIKMASNGTFSTVEKIINFTNKKDKHEPYYTELRKTASGYKAISYDNKLNKKEIDLECFAARKLFGNEALIKAASLGVTFIDHVKRVSPVYIKESMYVEHDAIEKTGSYIAHTKGGERITGKALTEIGFDGNPTGNMLFTDGCKFASSNKLKGIEVLANTNIVFAKLASFSVDKYKSFSIGDNKATIPLKFTNAMVKKANGVEMFPEPNIHGITSVEITSDIKGIYKMGSKMFISPDARLFEVGDKVEIETNHNNLLKIAQLESYGDEEITITKSNKGFLVKSGSLVEDMTKADALSTLVKFGSSEMEAHKALSKATKSSQTIAKKTLNYNAPKMLKPQQVDPKSVQPGTIGIRTPRMGKISRWIKNTKTTREKLAAIIPDENSVDAILSLGLVNEQSINVFRDAIPMMEECISRLASLILAIRYGFKRVPESVVTSAAEYLTKAVESLKDVFKIEDMAQSISSEHGV